MSGSRTPELDVGAFVAGFASSPLARWRDLPPWELTAQSARLLRELLGALPEADFGRSADIAVHRTATVEPGATLKGPLIVGPGCFVASGAYLRGGTWIAEHCTVGPGVELKSSFLFTGTTLAHYNFVGDSIVGADVNLEAGSIVCNARNERPDGAVFVRLGTTLVPTGERKFGALVGDGCRIGANAVLAPGTLLQPGTVVERGALVDQEAP